MAFLHGNTYNGRDIIPALSSRASSATLFIKHRFHDQIDGTADHNITKDLLLRETPRIPPRRGFYGCTPSASNTDLPESVEPHHDSTENDRAHRLRFNATSNTWTSSSGDTSESDDIQDRTIFVSEYNRLAKKYGVQNIIPEEYEEVKIDKVTISAKQGSWILRKVLRRTTYIQRPKAKSEKQVKHRRSISDISIRMHNKRDNLKDKHLTDLVRLCGSSPLYLPAEYAAGSLLVPTCFRATAQYLVQHAPTAHGIFRIPGSQSAILALYNHYASQDEDGEIISGTVRCPGLPEHIKCDVHDVASAFKKFLAGLPGGILGEFWLFDAFLAIHNQLDSDPEWTRTKQSKVRARLIAIAIATHPSRFQREIICAVFGLLCMIGRAAEIAPREDNHGRPLPTSHLMGYGPLGTVFGPLLLGDLLNEYTLRPGGLRGSPIFVQQSTTIQKSWKGRHKKSKSADDSFLASKEAAEKLKIVNGIAEMLITHWREAVRHMKSLGSLKSTRDLGSLSLKKTGVMLRPSASEYFTLRRPPEWDVDRASVQPERKIRSPLSHFQDFHKVPSAANSNDTLTVVKHRLRQRPKSTQKLSGAKSMSVLSPTVEESAEKSIDSLNHSNISKEILPKPKEYLQPELPISTDERAMQASHTPSNYVGPHQLVTLIDMPRAECAGTFPLLKNHTGELASIEYIQNTSNHIKNPQLSPKQTEKSSFGTKKNNSIEQKSLSLDEGEEIHRPIIPGLFETQNSPSTPNRQPATISPANPPQKVQVESRASSQVPQGLVSRRLKGIAASDPGLRPPSAFKAPVNSPSLGLSKQRQRGTTELAPQKYQKSLRVIKDPLSRISQEEDMASLASLAEVILSQSDCPSASASASPEIGGLHDFAVDLSKVELMKEKTSMSTSEEGLLKRRNYQQNKADTNNTSQPNDWVSNSITPRTPQRLTTDPLIEHHRGLSGVKAMAAKFNQADRGSVPSPSPIKPLQARRATDKSTYEPSLVSSYTTNPSPAPRSHRSSRSERSFKSIHQSLPPERRPGVSQTSSPVKNIISPFPKQLTVNQSPRNESPISKGLSLRHVERRSLDASGSPRRIYVDTSPFQKPSSLLRTGDGTSSFVISRAPSLRNPPARLDEPPVNDHEEFYRPRSKSVLSTSSPTRSLFGSCTCSPGPEPSFSSQISRSSNNGRSMLRGRGTSILYTQIQHLQRQLQAKVKEAEHLRRQLSTKGSLNDLGTLSEQLRQSNREVRIWQTRAEIAERRLETLAQLTPQQTDCDHSRSTHGATKCISCSYRQNIYSSTGAENKTILMGRIKKEMHGLDGNTSEDGSPKSDGTVKRTSPQPCMVSYSDLDIFCDARDTRLGLDTDTEGPYELA